MPELEHSPGQCLEGSDQYLSFFHELRRRAELLRAPDPDRAAQETMLAAWRDPAAGPTMRFRTLGAVPGTGSADVWPLGVFYAWLNTTLRRTVFRQLQAGKRLSSIDEAAGAAPAGFADTSIDAERSFANRELVDGLEDCIARLARRYRDVIELQRQGSSYQQIAAKFDVPANTVATWRARALIELAACMKRKRMLP